MNPESLEKVPFLQGLPQEAHAWVDAQLQNKEFDTDDIILVQGDPGDGLYFIQSGRVQILLEDDEPDARGQVVLATLGPGEVFGELAPLDGGMRTATVRALEPVRCWFLPQAALEAILERNPVVTRALLRLLVHRVRAADVRVQQETRDPLTGLVNRRVLADFFRLQAAETRRRGGKIAIVLLDLDGLKQINDSQGHEAGDRALVALANAMLSALRESDLAARYGGDEFVLVLPGADAEAARHVAERVRNQLVGAGASDVHFSFGVAAFEASPDAPPPALRDLLTRADGALYQSKAQHLGYKG